MWSRRTLKPEPKGCTLPGTDLTERISTLDSADWWHTHAAERADGCEVNIYLDQIKFHKDYFFEILKLTLTMRRAQELSS